MFKTELEIYKFEEDILTASDDGIKLPDHEWESEEEKALYEQTVFGRLID